jgi:hypothetical protein
LLVFALALAFQVLHDDVGLAPGGDADVEDLDDVLVADGGCRLRLPLKALEQIVAAG